MPVALIPSPLHSYTRGEICLNCAGENLREVLADLDGRFPGIRFRIVDEQDRIRPHIRFFVGGRMVRSIDEPVGTAERVQIVAALSGG